MVYSLTRLSQLLGDSELLAAAKFADSLFNKKNIDEDKTLDIIGGSAGAILGLLALYKATGSRDVLDNAIYCGAHLLKKRVVSRSGFRVWKCVQESPPLAGFSHGAAGIGYSLLKLYQETNEPELLLAANEAYSFESAIFDDKERNWPDFRVSKDEEFKRDGATFMSAWCHGAPRIALGRLGALDVLNSAGIQHDILTALETSKKPGVSGARPFVLRQYGAGRNHADGRNDIVQSAMGTGSVAAYIQSSSSRKKERWL
jgi:lantibiotic modifying enzyme